MIAVYSPTSLSRELRKELERALDRDGARISFVGTDGEDEYVIVEAETFHHATMVETRHHVKLLVPLALPAEAAGR